MKCSKLNAVFQEQTCQGQTKDILFPVVHDVTALHGMIFAHLAAVLHCMFSRNCCPPSALDFILPSIFCLNCYVSDNFLLAVLTWPVFFFFLYLSS